MAMLPLAIEDIKTRLLLGDGQTKKDEAPLSLGVLSMDEHGELKILEAPKENKKELMVLDDNANAGLIQAIEKDYMDLNEDGSYRFVNSSSTCTGKWSDGVRARNFRSPPSGFSER